MATDDPIRASDADREVVVATLREAYTAGRLNLDEFDERMTAAYESKTWGDLRMLTADLPSQPMLGGDVPGRHLPLAGVAGRQPADPSAPGLAADPVVEAARQPDPVSDPAGRVDHPGDAHRLRGRGRRGGRAAGGDGGAHVRRAAALSSV